LVFRQKLTVVTDEKQKCVENLVGKVSRFTVGEQEALVRIENKFPEFVFYACLFGSFAHVKKMSELCPNELKTVSGRICDDDGYQLDE